MRARSQLHMAESRGADLIAFPAPLICGSQPGTFAGSSAYQTRLVDALHILCPPMFRRRGFMLPLFPLPLLMGRGSYSKRFIFETDV